MSDGLNYRSFEQQSPKDFALPGGSTINFEDDQGDDGGPTPSTG